MEPVSSARMPQHVRSVSRPAADSSAGCRDLGAVHTQGLVEASPQLCRQRQWRFRWPSYSWLGWWTRRTGVPTPTTERHVLSCSHGINALVCSEFVSALFVTSALLMVLDSIGRCGIACRCMHTFYAHVLHTIMFERWHVCAVRDCMLMHAHEHQRLMGRLETPPASSRPQS
jgi:hypothetical protein